MGAYYMPVNTTKRVSLYSHDYGSGLKLWEHCYVPNPMVEAVVRLLGKEWSGDRIIWGCDYTDPTPEFTMQVDGKPEESNAYAWAKEVKVYPEGGIKRFIVNLSKKEFYDREAIKEDEDGYKISPLPFLTTDGVNLGGGGFVSKDPLNQICSWSGDCLTATDEKPENYKLITLQIEE